MRVLMREEAMCRLSSLNSRCVLWAGLALAGASLGVAVAGQARGAQPPAQAAAAQAPQPAFGEPVNIYARNPFAPPREDGEIHSLHVSGQVWLLTGEPGGA